MTTEFRAHNFFAGPAALPTEVLIKAQQELLCYKNTGISIMEMSHRGAIFTAVLEQAKERLRRLQSLPDDMHILFLQGGASHQFMMLPYNFLGSSQTALYLDTGVWSDKAIKEAQSFGKVEIPFSSKEGEYKILPEPDSYQLPKNAAYLHFTSNNTIYGTQYSTEPEHGDLPLVCDASSDFLSRTITIDEYSMIYAGAQKNLGPSGVTLVLIRDEFLQNRNIKRDIPTILDYTTHTGKLFNTPPTFAIYLVNLVLEWLEGLGGISEMEQMNQIKKELIYHEIDEDDFYQGTADKRYRSGMNVTFRLKNHELESRFLTEAEQALLLGLKGYRTVGGIRASIYNAVTVGDVRALVSFMRDFRSRYG